MTAARTAAPPDVSILVPAYQQERYIADAVRSVLAQTGVTAEIILSDDASSDRTYARLSAVAEGYRGPHRLVVRRNTRNQGNGHVAQLSELAASDIQVMAHGDDLAEPHRCRRLLDEFDRTGAYAVSSNVYDADEAGHAFGLLLPDPGPLDLTASEIAATGWQPALLGAGMAWRREVYSHFPRLDGRYLPVSHDTLVPFRGALLGGMRYVPEPLLRYRRHAAQWHLRQTDLTPATRRESVLNNALMPRQAMVRDLDHLLSTMPAGPERERLAALRAEVAGHILKLVAEWLDARQALYEAGWQPFWQRRSYSPPRPGWPGSELLRRSRLFAKRWRWQLLHR